ncbi:polysaccharide deacetylase family protein [Marinimicrobium sp. ABcell2]|uniref:polysaccharide deacetylase family protein n=1 Tax=Marinimicrobium sp. ABcell2 TaxID=3069751 RepID=UPI0027B17E51|nr:polysaccharide deacetylase family protein [Marinimicrobium sp. ABcell2]MDQ2076164.1 polysaccharide deacetylase family protein [Marinimicrobium sp. ABcell2]
MIKPVFLAGADYFGAHRRATAEPRLWILMYHRILPREDERFASEEPGMVVQPDSFDMHLRELKRHFDVVTLGEWIAAKDRGETLPKKACAITFDDGWRDNYEYAFPALKAHQLPATLFAVAEKIGTDFQFWPNVVAGLLHAGAGPEMARHPVFSDAIQGHERNREDIAACINRLKANSDEAIFRALEDINWRSMSETAPALMSWEQLREMQSSGLVEIGSHTCSHRRLNGDMAQDALVHEIVHSKDVLETQTGQSVNLFCFPNGDYTPAALDLVKNHYQAAVTTQSGINQGGAIQPHELTRLGMHDDISNTGRRFNARLSGWL